MNSVLQISLITFVQIAYIILILRESRKKQIFKNYGVKIQYICQESATLVFLVVLCIFSYLQNTRFEDSRTYSAMQTIVVVAVFVAITAQVISVVWGIFHSIAEFFQDRAKKKSQEKITRIEKSLREAQKSLAELNIELSEIKDKEKPRVTRSLTKSNLPVKIVCYDETQEKESVLFKKPKMQTLEQAQGDDEGKCLTSKSKR